MSLSFLIHATCSLDKISNADTPHTKRHVYALNNTKASYQNKGMGNKKSDYGVKKNHNQQ